MPRIGTIVLNVKDAGRASLFWSRALGYPYQGGAYRAETTPVLLPPSASPVAVAFDESDRSHLDLHTDSAAEQRAEVERLVSLGPGAPTGPTPTAPVSSSSRTPMATCSAWSTPALSNASAPA